MVRSSTGVIDKPNSTPRAVAVPGRLVELWPLPTIRSLIRCSKYVASSTTRSPQICWSKPASQPSARSGFSPGLPR
jgi:hypothetical protein